MPQRQLAPAPPIGMGSDVLDDHALFEVRGRTAGADLGPDQRPVDGCVELGGQARRRCVADAPFGAVEQEQRTEQPGALLLDHAHDPIQRGLERCAHRYLLQHLALSRVERAGESPVGQRGLHRSSRVHALHD